MCKIVIDLMSERFFHIGKIGDNVKTQHDLGTTYA